MASRRDDEHPQQPDRDWDAWRIPDPTPSRDRDWERITPSQDRPPKEDYPGPGINPPSPWPEDSDE